jgi:hypothetical protein
MMGGMSMPGGPGAGGGYTGMGGMGSMGGGSGQQPTQIKLKSTIVTELKTSAPKTGSFNTSKK